MKPESLILKGGVHILRVDSFIEYITKKPTCRITCVDDLSETQDDDGNWIDAFEDGCYYLSESEIDILIAKLTVAKAYLQNPE